MLQVARQENRESQVTAFPPPPTDRVERNLSEESINLRHHIREEAAVRPQASPAGRGMQELADMLHEEFLLAHDAWKEARQRLETIEECRENIYSRKGLEEKLAAARQSMKDLMKEAACPELKEDLRELEKEKEKNIKLPRRHVRLIEECRLTLDEIKYAADQSTGFEINGKHYDRESALRYCKNRIETLSREHDEIVRKSGERIEQIDKQYAEKTAELKAERHRKAEAIRGSEGFRMLEMKCGELQTQLFTVSDNIRSASSILGDELLRAEKQIIARRRFGWATLTAVGTALTGWLSVMAACPPAMLALPLSLGLAGYLLHNAASPPALLDKLDLAEIPLKRKVKQAERTREIAFNKLRKFYVKNSRFLGTALPNQPEE